jgi:hypothetical protein
MKRIALVLVLIVSGLPLSSTARSVFYQGGVDSVEVGTQAYTYFSALVHDDNFAAEPGVHFVYQTDPACASFDGSAIYEGFTDEFGRAASPRITAGNVLTLDCETSLTVDGVAASIDLPLHIFSAATAVYAPVTNPVDAFTGTEFFVDFIVTESGLPVNLLPVTVQIGTAPNGATATLAQTPIYGLNSGLISFRLIANEKQGRYDITTTDHGHTATLTVNQRKK